MNQRYFQRPMTAKEGRNASSVSRGAISSSKGGWMNAMSVRAAELMPEVPAKMSAMKPVPKPHSKATERDVPQGKVMMMMGHSNGAP